MNADASVSKTAQLSQVSIGTRTTGMLQLQQSGQIETDITVGLHAWSPHYKDEYILESSVGSGLQKCEKIMIWWDESSFTIFSRSGQAHVWRTHRGRYTPDCLTPVATVWGHFPGMVGVSRLFRREGTMQINTKSFWVITVILWGNISILMGWFWSLVGRQCRQRRHTARNDLISLQITCVICYGLHSQQISTQFSTHEILEWHEREHSPSLSSLH